MVGEGALELEHGTADLVADSGLALLVVDGGGSWNGAHGGVRGMHVVGVVGAGADRSVVAVARGCVAGHVLGSAGMMEETHDV